ncbi:MAG: adenylate kinase [Chloroflexota bacterium]
MDGDFARIAIIGTSCSGKTALAWTLANVLDVPHIELDALHWQPNWTPRPIEEFRSLTRTAVAAERWVLDGNYSKVRALTWARATVLIWLNYPFQVIFGRALSRTVRRVLFREQLFAGNREGFRQAFLSRDSILLWVLQTYQRRRHEYPALFEQPEYSHLTVMELRTPQETDRFVAVVRAVAGIIA